MLIKSKLWTTPSRALGVNPLLNIVGDAAGPLTTMSVKISKFCDNSSELALVPVLVVLIYCVTVEQ